MAQSFVSHPSFPLLKPWMQAQIYGRDGGPKKAKQRRRIELLRTAPRHIVQLAIDATMLCPACGDRMHPFRFRKGAKRAGDVPQHLYFAATCPERPSEQQLTKWKRLLADSTTPKIRLRRALEEAVKANKTCCKGSAATQEYKRVIAALERP